MNKETVLYVACKISLFYGDRILYYGAYSLPVSHIPHQVVTPVTSHQVVTPGWHMLIEVLVAIMIAK